MKNIIWLASYPKSGNTWLRAFISSLIGLEVISENGKFASFSTQCNARDAFEDAYRGEIAPPTEGTNAWRRPFQRRMSDNMGSETLYVKTHGRYTTADGEVLFEPEVSDRAVLVVRNPIDVCASLTNHFGVKAAVAMDMLSNPKAAMARNSKRNFETPLGDWTSFNRSWLEQKDIPLTVLRYEDMFYQPEETFSAFARDFLGISDPERIARAIEAANFDQLQDREKRFGFNERPAQAERFFWKGKPWHGLEMLSRPEQSAVWARHKSMANALGYFYRDGTITLKPLPAALST